MDQTQSLLYGQDVIEIDGVPLDSFFERVKRFFTNLWDKIVKFVGGKPNYDYATIQTQIVL